MEHTAEEMQHHLRMYWGVFIALVALTVVTVLFSLVHLGPEGNQVGNIGVGLLIAVTKGSLVALFFMHLSNEKKLIYGSLLLTVVLFFAMMFLPIFTKASPVSGTTSLQAGIAVQEGHGHGPH